MDRIERIGRRNDGPERLVAVSAAWRVERHEPDPERRERESRRGQRHSPPDGVEDHGAEPGHVDVSV